MDVKGDGARGTKKQTVNVKMIAVFSVLLYNSAFTLHTDRFNFLQLPNQLCEGLRKYRHKDTNAGW